MTEIEVKKLFAVMTVAYPNWHISDIDFTAKIWADLLSDYTYEQTDMALKAYITSNTSGFAPDIGQMIATLHIIFTPQKPTAIEAWALVNDAIKRSSYYSVEEFAKLPRDIQRAVGTPGQLKQWATDEHFSESVASSNFMRTYNDIIKVSENISRMPASTQALIATTNSNSYVAQIEQKNVNMSKLSLEDKNANSERNTSNRKANCKLTGEEIDKMISELFN